MLMPIRTMQRRFLGQRHRDRADAVAAQKPALQVSQHLEIRYLARLMIQYAVKSVLVIDNNELQGFVSDTDVVSHLIDRATGGR